VEPTRTPRPRITARLLAVAGGLALVAAAAAPLLTAEPAMAASGLQHVTQTSPTASNPSKVVVGLRSSFHGLSAACLVDSVRLVTGRPVIASSRMHGVRHGIRASRSV
jgi:hypothetical protein